MNDTYDSPAGQAAPVENPTPKWPHAGSQPLWEAAADHADHELATRLGKDVRQLTPRDRAEHTHTMDPGPHRVHHTRPTLTTGSAGEHVVELARLLKANGYADSSMNDGTNMANVLDASVMNDVRRFVRDHPGAVNDPVEYMGREQSPDVFVGTHIGPYVWEALYRVADEKAHQAAA